MSNIKVSIFDLVSFIIPGIVVLLSLTIGLNEKIKSLEKLVTIFKGLDLTTSFILIGLSYVIGFATYGIGSYTYRKVDKFFWKDTYHTSKYEESNNVSVSAYKWSIIREYSQANFMAINRWAALKGMASNLTIGLFLLAISCITKFEKNEYLSEWIVIFISCLIMSLLLLNRARVYRRYREFDIIGTLKMIDGKLKTEKKTP